MTKAAPGIYEKLEDAEYRALDAVAHSDLRAWVTGERATGRQLVVGRAFHACLTLPAYAKQTFAVMEEEADLRTAAGKLALTEFESRTGKVGLRPSERILIRNMVQAIKQHDKASRIVAADGEVELAVLAELHLSVLSKGLIDKKCKGCLIDFKTTGCKDEYEFVNSIYKFGYDSAGAYYVDLVAKATGKYLPFYWCVVSKRNYDVWVLRMTPEQYTTGKRWYETVLNLYSRFKVYSEVASAV